MHVTPVRPQERPARTEPVIIDAIGDGKPRELRYTIGTMQRLKKRFKKSMLGLQGSLLSMDEDVLPALIFEGLKHDPDESGNACSCGFHGPDGIEPDITLEALEKQPTNCFQYFLNCFTEAYTGSRPVKKNAGENLQQMMELATKLQAIAGTEPENS